MWRVRRLTSYPGESSYFPRGSHFPLSPFTGTVPNYRDSRVLNRSDK